MSYKCHVCHTNDATHTKVVDEHTINNDLNLKEIPYCDECDGDIEQYKSDYNVVVHETDDEIIFTTHDRIAASLLEKIVDGANLTNNENEYHYQGWVSKR